jgi:hypothetical protein
MTKRVRRRLFLSSLLGGCLVAAGIGVAVLPLAPELRLRRLLRTRLDYLQIPDEVIEAFTKDFIADAESGRFQYFSSTSYLAQRVVYGMNIFTDRLPIFRFERLVISAFLLSTNFFRDGADVHKPLRYVGYNHPYRGGCVNPFARL